MIAMGVQKITNPESGHGHSLLYRNVGINNKFRFRFRFRFRFVFRFQSLAGN